MRQVSTRMKIKPTTAVAGDGSPAATTGYNGHKADDTSVVFSKVDWLKSRHLFVEVASVVAYAWPVS